MMNTVKPALSGFLSSAANILRLSPFPAGTSKPIPPDGSPSVIKSPLDSKHYKVVELKNGLRATLVSTCVHEIDRDALDSTVYKSFLSTKPATTSTSTDADSTSSLLQHKIDSFNEVHLGIQAYNQFGDLEPNNSKVAVKGLGMTTNIVEDGNDSQIFSPTPGKVPKLVSCCNKCLATVCVTVGAGSFHDPKNTSGLAHLVEHAIFLGSKEYPEPNTLFTKVFENGGVVNASTFAEHTNFYFACALSAFEESVHILVDSLTNPLFKESALRREIEAVDSEFGIKQTCELTRVDDFLRSLANTGHPFRTFYWGNKSTLSRLDIQSQVLTYKNRYYVANNMTVCIQAPIPMAKLERLFVNLFSNIPSAPFGSRSPSEELLDYGPPFNKDTFQMCYFVAPLTHLTCLVISWSLPADLWKNYETKPLTYVKLMIQNTSPGGLKHYLRKKKWMSEWSNSYGNCCPCDQFCRNTYCSLFNITIYLTDKGYAEKGEVIKAVFSYLKLISRGGIRARTFEEMKRTTMTKFHFQNWDEILQSSISIALSMRHVPPEHILTSNTLLTKWSPDAIQKCVDMLTPRAANYTLVSRENVKVCRSSAWPSGIQFTKEYVSEENYKALEQVQVYPEFSLPPDGTFLTKKISLKTELDVSPMQSDKSPVTIFKSDKLLVKHFNRKRSRSLTPRLPSAKYSVYFCSHVVAGRWSRMKQGVLEYWARLLSDKLIQQVGHQFDHLFSYEIGINDAGILVDVEGPRCYLVDLLTMIVRLVFDCGEDSALSDEDFAEDLRQDMICKCCNDTFCVEMLSDDMIYYLLQVNHASLFGIRNELQDVSVADGDFARLIRNFRRRMVVIVDLQGFVTTQDSLRIVDLFTGRTEERIEYARPAILPETIDRGTILPRGSSILCIRALHPAYVTSVVINFYQVDLWPGENAQDFQSILVRLMRRRIFDQLRTKEQLGYVVQLISLHERDMGSTGFYVKVLCQPHKFSTTHVDTRIDSFLRQFYLKYLRRPETKSYLQRVYSLTDEHLQDLERFYVDNLLKNGANFRKLSIQLEGYKQGTKISIQRQEQLTKAGRDDEIRNGGSGENENEELDSLIELEYLNVENEGQKKKLQKEATHIIDNIAYFKRELGLLPAVSTY